MSMLREMIEHAESNAEASTDPADAEVFEESADLFKLVFATCAALNMPPPSITQGRPPHTFIPPTKKRRAPRHQRDYSQSSWGTLYLSKPARAQLILPGSKAAKKFRRRSVSPSSHSSFTLLLLRPVFKFTLSFIVHTNAPLLQISHPIFLFRGSGC